MDIFIRYKKIKERLNKGKMIFNYNPFADEFTNEFGILCGAFTEEFTNEFETQCGTLCGGIDTPILWYNGQYQRGKDNISILAPVIYIEMPKILDINYFPRKLQVAKNVAIKIHILSIAPYKSMDNPMQDSNIEKHNILLKRVEALLNGFEVKNEKGKLIASQFILNSMPTMSYMSSFVVSVLEYKCEFYEKEPIQSCNME